MSIRLTPEAKVYLEQVLANDQQYIRLSMQSIIGGSEMSYVITWTNYINPRVDIALTHRDWNVIVIDRAYKKYFDDVLLGFDTDTSTKIIVAENPNVLVLKNGNFLIFE